MGGPFFVGEKKACPNNKPARCHSKAPVLGQIESAQVVRSDVHSNRSRRFAVLLGGAIRVLLRQCVLHCPRNHSRGLDLKAANQNDPLAIFRLSQCINITVNCPLVTHSGTLSIRVSKVLSSHCAFRLAQFKSDS